MAITPRKAGDLKNRLQGTSLQPGCVTAEGGRWNSRYSRSAGEIHLWVAGLSVTRIEKTNSQTVPTPPENQKMLGQPKSWFR